MSISVQKQDPQQQVSSPSSERLHRLVVAAAGYRGIETGDPLPIDEIVEQGKANGYTEDEIRALIQREYGSTQTIAVPPQEDIFGEMWRVEEETVATNMGGSEDGNICFFYTTPSPRERGKSRMPSSSFKKKQLTNSTCISLSSPSKTT